MKNFLKKKGITLSPKVYFIDALGSMAFGLFATLLVGTILNTIGSVCHIEFLSKGTKNTTQKRVAFIEDWINNYPKKLFNYKTPFEIFSIG